VVQKTRSVTILASHALEGGTVNFANALKKSLEDNGYQVHRLALYRGGDTWDRNGFEEILTPDDRLGPIGMVKAWFKLMSALRKSQPDVIMGLMPMANVAAGFATFFVPGAAIATHHSPFETDSRIMRILDRLLGMWGRFTRIVSVSNAVADSYGDHPASYRRGMVLIPNGIPTNIPDAGRGAIRAKFGVREGRPFALMAGRLAEQKNVLAAVEAMASIPEADFLLTGKGPLESEVRARIDSLGAGDHVRLLGLVDKQDLTNLMYECDAFVQVSLFEGQSVALLEAAAASAPMVVSAIPTQLEVVTTPVGPAGITCDPNSVADIARAIREMLFSAAAREAVARGADYLRNHSRSEADAHADYLRMLGEVTQRPHATLGLATA